VSEKIKTKALVLNSIRWKESSKIMTLYARHFGKVKVIVRGVYRKNSSFAGKLETLMLLDAIIDVKESRSMQILVETDVDNAFMDIRTDLKLLPYGLVILELINQLFTEPQKDEVFFDFIIEMLSGISVSKYPENILLYFLLKLSSYLGFKPALQTCVAGDLSKCDSKVFLAIMEGHVYCKNCNSSSATPLALTRDQFFYLKNLQMQNHRRIKNWGYTMEGAFQLIYLLVDYINYHTDYNLHIDALRLLNNK
jgi:DNA repair protein RecO (recombination protein O)